MYILQAVHAHPDIEEAAQGMKEAVRDLGQTLEEAASESGVVSGLIDSIGKALAEVRCSSTNSLQLCYKCVYRFIGWVGKNCLHSC